MTQREKLALLSISMLGLFVPNGMFLYFIFVEFTSISAVLSDLLALGFIIDAFLATGLLAWFFARHPIGKHSWRMFVLLSLIGGLGFSIPFFYYLNKR